MNVLLFRKLVLSSSWTAFLAPPCQHFPRIPCKCNLSQYVHKNFYKNELIFSHCLYYKMSNCTCIILPSLLSSSIPHYYSQSEAISFQRLPSYQLHAHHVKALCQLIVFSLQKLLIPIGWSPKKIGAFVVCIILIAIKYFHWGHARAYSKN